MRFEISAWKRKRKRMMTDLFSQLNLDFSHAVRGTSTNPQPSGVKTFSATAAAEKSGFCFNTLGNPADVMTYEQIQATIWRIEFQIVAMLMSDYRAALVDEEKSLWKSRILEVLVRMNETAQTFNPQSIPCDIPAPTDLYRVLNATMGNWCCALTQELTCLFMNVPIVDTSRIEYINE